MPSNEFLLRDAQGLELEIERHCAGLGLDCKNESQVRQFAREMLQGVETFKEAANKGDRTARAKVELYGMVLMLHDVNSKVFGPEYVTNMDALAEQESSWLAIARAMWDELKSRDPDNL